MKRVQVKIGDIFKVSVGNNRCRYFHYIGDDSIQLGSNVIRVFREEYLCSDSIILESIVNRDVDFYAHCIIKLGLKLGYWEKVGSVKKINKYDIFFRDTEDYGYKEGEPPIDVSFNWYVWRNNGENYIFKGDIRGKYEDSYIGLVIPPDSIVHKIKNGVFDFIYPKFK